MRGAMFTATRPLFDRAKQNASVFSRPNAKIDGKVSSGALREATVRSFRVGKGGAFLSSGSTFTMSVGPRVKHAKAVSLYNLVHRPRQPRRGIYHGHFLEWGTRKGVVARHYLERALRATQGACVALLSSEIAKRIARALGTRRPVND